MTTVANHIVNSRRLKIGTAYLAGLILSGVGGWNGYQHIQNPEHPRGTRYSRTQIKNRATEIGIALNGSVRILGDPMLHTEQPRVHDSKFATRKMWIILCESNHHQVNMSIDDATGRLTCLIMDVNVYGARGGQQEDVKTERDAVVASAAKLRVLQTLPPTAQIALNEHPLKEGKQNLWHVNWLVRNTAKSQPYVVKMSLNSQTGQPTYLVNLEEKG